MKITSTTHVLFDLSLKREVFWASYVVAVSKGLLVGLVSLPFNGVGTTWP